MDVPLPDTVNVSWDLFTLEFDQIYTTNVLPCYGNSTGSILFLLTTLQDSHHTLIVLL